MPEIWHLRKKSFEVLVREGSKCHWLEKQIELFSIQPLEIVRRIFGYDLSWVSRFPVISMILYGNIPLFTKVRKTLRHILSKQTIFKLIKNVISRSKAQRFYLLFCFLALRSLFHSCPAGIKIHDWQSTCTFENIYIFF